MRRFPAERPRRREGKLPDEMAAGTDATFERLQPVLDAIAGKCTASARRPGRDGKIIHQLLAGVHIAAAEAMALAAPRGHPAGRDV